MQLKPGTKLQNGKYEIVRTLGQGGFGITYEAEQIALRRKVAIKEFFMKEYCERDGATSHVTLGTSSGSKELVERFRVKFVKEARTIATLNHPHIVKIIDVFEENGTAYYVMLYLEGGSLADLCKDGRRLSEAEALHYTRQIASALDYLHHRPEPMNHLDVKPSNVLLDENGDAVLIDFGISKRYDEKGGQTSSTPVGISHGYSPLEQYKDGGVKEFSPATDIYSLGATLYTLLTGQTPPQANDIFESGLPGMPGISPWLRKAIEAAMQPRRTDRPQSIDAFLALLDAPVDSEETVVPSKSKPESKPVHKTPKTPGEKKKSKAWLWALIACAVVAAIITAFVQYVRDEALSRHRSEALRKELMERRRMDSLNKAKPVAIEASIPVEKANPVEIPISGSINGHDWVDLGLSVKWATCNVGASSPSDYGNYFAWGETRPKSEYTWSNLRYCDDNSGNSFAKYNTDSRYGTVDNKKKLELADDAARQNWGGSWRMPTDAELTELREKCIWTWTTQDGKNGCRVTSKTNGNCIFLPAAGYRLEDILYFAGSFGDYRSSSLNDPYGAWHLGFNSNEVDRRNSVRCLGLPVRPVSE